MNGRIEAVGVGFVVVCVIRQGADRLAHRPLRTGDQLIGKRNDAVQVILVHELQQSLSADRVAGHLAIEVADHFLRSADVGAQDFEQVHVGLTALEQLQDGDVQSLFIDIHCVWAVGAPADIRGVANVPEERDQVSVPEDRRHDCDVVVVTTGQPRIVGDNHVTRLERLGRVFVQHVHDAAGHRVDVARRSGDCLRQHVATWVEHTGGQVAAFRYGRRERGPDQRDRLLLHGRDQPTPEGLQDEWVERV